MQNRTVEQIVDVPSGGLVDLIQHILQGRLSERIVEQTVDMPVVLRHQASTVQAAENYRGQEEANKVKVEGMCPSENYCF